MQTVPDYPPKRQEPPGGFDGWSLWAYTPPPYGAGIVEVWRPGWLQSHVMSRDASPSMNVAGLYWRRVFEGGETVN